jgi:hypothetical protein
LSLLAFPQSWDGDALVVRLLCLPKGDPLGPLQAGLPSFAAAHMVFEAQLIGSLDRLPLVADASPVGPLVLDEPPTQKSGLFSELAAQFKIKPRATPPKLASRFRKVITPSYRALIGDRQHSQYLTDAKELECALHQGGSDQPAKPIDPPDTVSWGQVLAFALRQPRLASGLGLVAQTTVVPPKKDFFAAGGWLYIDLHPTSDYAAFSGISARYAARIPPLSSTPRTVFAAVLFPVEPAADFNGDEIFAEAELYDDGFSKQVHCAQDDERGDSIQLAWDDEQLALWFNRQAQRKSQLELVTDSPNGVAGYRVDVRLAGTLGWTSLMRVQSVGDLRLGALSIGRFNGESLVEVVPSQISPKQAGEFWFPSYFANWRGSSLALTDTDLVNLHARPDVQDPTTPPYLLNREKNFIPVGDKDVQLTYGRTYEFRVRLSDLTRGGPNADVRSPEPPRNTITTVTFRRRKPPGPVEVLGRPAAGSLFVKIAKPKLGYPEALFTGVSTFADLAADLDTLSADRTITRAIGVPDPDVLTVEVQVQARSLDGDVATYAPLYTTTRAFPANELTIPLDLRDVATLAEVAAVQPAAGPLAVPSARDIRLVLTAIGRPDASYFADDKARRGTPVLIDVRANASAESPLLTDPDNTSAVRSFFFQPPPSDNSVPRPSERLAAELGLDGSGLLLSSTAKRRTIFACSADLRHTLSPEAASITFSSEADLVQRWINVVCFELQRDWTWDGLGDAGIEIIRTEHYPAAPDVVNLVGTVHLPRAISPKLAVQLSPDLRAAERQSTTLLFFDAFDPKPKLRPDHPDPSPHKFPSEITIEYTVQPHFQALAAPAPARRDILLPITTPPAQVPRIVSAGIAFSSYQAAADYSSTQPRDRSLWFEFAEPPVDPDDSYFVRILAYGPDPLLMPWDASAFPSDGPPPDSVEPPLALDPEWMRLIHPGQPRDESGLRAMRAVEGSGSDASHYLIPLPDNLNQESLELFGFFTYEVRVGHTAARWSTAQGRFGPMLRVAGVQHPAPQLLCEAARTDASIVVRAPYATPVIGGANVRPQVPKTELWGLLYARVRQTDASSWRNVLLSRIVLVPPRAGNDPVGAGKRMYFGEGAFPLDGIESALRQLALPPTTPLTLLVAELFGEPSEADPLGERLGHGRLLRVSSLIPVPDAC